MNVCLKIQSHTKIKQINRRRNRKRNLLVFVKKLETTKLLYNMEPNKIL